jgi:hypothetical protein
MIAVKLPVEVKQNNLPPECGEPIDVGDTYPFSKCTVGLQLTNNRFVPASEETQFSKHVVVVVVAQSYIYARLDKCGPNPREKPILAAVYRGRGIRAEVCQKEIRVALA